MNIVQSICPTATKLYSGSKKLHSACSENIRPVRRTLPLTGWEQRELSCGWRRNKNINGWPCQYFTRFGGNWPICWLVGGAALSLGPRMIQYLVEVSWEGWLKYTDLTLAYTLYHAVSCASAASSGWSLHLIISQLRTKHSSSNCPSHVRRTKGSIKKRIIVRRTVRSMFGEQTVRPIKNGLNYYIIQGPRNKVVPPTSPTSNRSVSPEASEVSTPNSFWGSTKLPS